MGITAAPPTHEVTIVVPTRNSGRFIEPCLRSIRAQTVPCTLVVVDNNSTDDTAAVAARYADAVLQSGPERNHQRNAGARSTDSPYVGFIDSDMILEPDVVREAAALLSRGVGAVIVPEHSVGDGYWAHVREFERSFYVGSDSVEAARFFRRSIFEASGGFDEGFVGGEDWDLSRRVAVLAALGRTDARIMHDEGTLTFLGSCRKKAQYAPGLAIFARKHGAGTLLKILLSRPYLRRPWQLMYPHPLLGGGLLLLKGGEASSAVIFLLYRALATRLRV